MVQGESISWELAFLLAIVGAIVLIQEAIVYSLWLLALVPVPFLIYLWFTEGVPWRGRVYGYQQMPEGGLVYSGEKSDCRCCNHIQAQLDYNYGIALLTESERLAREDWREHYPCSLCWRSGASTKQDFYKGPVRWAEGERP